MTTLGNAYALLRYEMMKVVTLGVVVKKCANCGRYFVPEGRSDTEYCSRVLDDQPEKTCQSVGALLKHQKKVENNRVYQEYQKAYKRHNSRTRQRKMTQSEFLAWSDEARQHRQECLDGKMSEEDFIAWLNRDRVYRREG